MQYRQTSMQMEMASVKYHVEDGVQVKGGLVKQAHVDGAIGGAHLWIRKIGVDRLEIIWSFISVCLLQGT